MNDEIDYAAMTFEQFHSEMEAKLAAFSEKVATHEDYEDFRAGTGGTVAFGDWIEWFGCSEGFM